MQVGVHCVDCLGTGMDKTRNEIGLISYKPCNSCGGLGKKLAEEGGGEHRMAANIGAMKGYFDRQKRK